MAIPLFMEILKLGVHTFIGLMTIPPILRIPSFEDAAKDAWVLDLIEP